MAANVRLLLSVQAIDIQKFKLLLMKKKNTKAGIKNVKPALQQATVKCRAKLSDVRKAEFEIFRYNLRLLRASVGKSAAELAAELKLRTLKRINDLEEGRTSQPKFEEVLLFAKYFNVTLDQLLYQKAEVSFKPCT